MALNMEPAALDRAADKFQSVKDELADWTDRSVEHAFPPPPGSDGASVRHASQIHQSAARHLNALLDWSARLGAHVDSLRGAASLVRRTDARNARSLGDASAEEERSPTFLEALARSPYRYPAPPPLQAPDESAITPEEQSAAVHENGPGSGPLHASAGFFESLAAFLGEKSAEVGSIRTALQSEWADEHGDEADLRHAETQRLAADHAESLARHASAIRSSAAAYERAVERTPPRERLVAAKREAMASLGSGA